MREGSRQRAGFVGMAMAAALCVAAAAAAVPARAGEPAPPAAAAARPVAGAHYVAPQGTASWEASTDPNAPCPPVTAMKSAKAGDTVYFRGGTYEVGQSEGYQGFWGPASSGAEGKPITFACYPGEKVTFEGRTELRGGGRKTNYQLTTRALGNQYQSHIVFDGFHFVAKDRTGFCGIIISRGCDHKDSPEAWVKGCVVRNCTFDGGDFVIGSHPDDNPNSADNNEALRIEETDGTLVQNCRFWNLKHVKDNHNISAIKTYHNRNMVIENCEIYDCSVAIFAKSNSDDSVFRFNFIHDCRTGFDCTAFGWKANGGGNRADGFWVSDSSRCKIQGSVFANNGGSVSAFAQDSANIDDLEISGNTFYGGGIGLTDTAGTKCHDNVIVATKGLGLDYNRQKIEAPMAEFDHNQWGPKTDAIVNVYVKGRPSALRYTLEKWKASKEIAGEKSPGEGDLASDPKFLNKSGTMKELEDFRLAPDSPCRKAGRDGGDIGADVDKVGPRRK